MEFDTERNLSLRIQTLKEWKKELDKQVANLEYEARKCRDESFALDVKRGILASMYESAATDSPEHNMLLKQLRPVAEEFHDKLLLANKLVKEADAFKITAKSIQDRIETELNQID